MRPLPPCRPLGSYSFIRLLPSADPADQLPHTDRIQGSQRRHQMLCVSAAPLLFAELSPTEELGPQVAKAVADHAKQLESCARKQLGCRAW